MGIWIFYLLATIPLVVGGVIWFKEREVNWIEWIGGSLIGFITAFIFQFVSITGMTHDVETWSGWISSATHWPEWVEQYHITHTVSCGEDCTITYVTTHYRTHGEHWTAATTIPDEHEIDRVLFDGITKNFGGGIVTEHPYKSGFYSGDPNSYVCYRKTDFLYPVTAKKWWSNRIKAAPSLFSFSKVPTNITVYPWPDNPDWLHSQRLIGAASKDVDLVEFDRLNARLGARKFVNVIMVGFGNKDVSYAEWQRAKWIGGKKNDLVLCYGDSWAKVFGWSDSEICKRNLETILLKHKKDTAILTLIEAEIVQGYTIKDWSAFDYITVEPPAWSYIVFLIVLGGSQAGFYYWAARNEY